MSVMTKQFSGLFLKALIAALAISTLLAAAMWVKASAQEAPAPLHPALGGIHSVEAAQFQQPFALETYRVIPEVLTYLQTALGQESAFTTDSPADATLTLSCEGHDCRDLRADLRQGGLKGPVIWQTRAKVYSLYAFDRFWSVEKPAWKVAQTIARRLADDVAKARAAAPVD